jgi:hypothetical protein
MPSAHPDIVPANADITLDKSADPYAGGKSRDLLWKTDGQDNEKILWVNKNEGEVNYRQEGQYAAKIRAVDKAGNRSNWSDPVKFIVDRRLPKVKKVTSTAQSDKIFKAGDKIDITLEFDKPMFVGGDPRLYLNATGRYAVYDSGHGTNKLKFIYTVQKNDKADPLDYANKMALKDKDHRTDTGITADIVDKAGNKIAELPLSGNKGILAAEKIKVDAVAPVGETMSVKINDDAVKTRQRRVTLKLDRGSANTDVNKMRVRNAGRNWEEWSNYQSTLSDFVLAPGDDGVRNVEAQFKDAAGNISEVVSDDIILDTTGPTGKIEIKVYKSVDTYASGEVTRNKNVKISLVGLSADAKMVKAAGDIAEPNPYKDYVNRPGDNALFVDLTDGSGEKKITVSASDELGNKTDFTDTVTLDLDPPDGPVGLKVTPEGWTSKASWTVTWESAAPDVASAWYSVDGKKAEPAEIAAQSFTITGLDEGDHEVKVWLEDAAGNADPNKYGTVHLKLDQTDPTNPSSPCQGYEIQGGASISDLYSAGYTSRNPYFVWSDANDFDASGRTGSGIKGYYVYFGTDEYPDPVRDGVFQTANNYTAPGNLINGQTYRLVVRTVDNADRLAGGKIRLFTYKYVGETNAPTITVDKASFDLTVQQGQTLSPNPVFMVGNSGNASLNYTVSVPATDTWLTLVPPASRTIPAGSTGQITEQFVVSAVNLTQPTYTTTITITDNFATNSPVMIPVTLQVVAASTTHTFDLVPGVNWISIPAENPTANGVNIIDQATLWQSLDLKDNDLIEKPEAGKSSYTSYFEDSALGRIGTNYPVNPGDCYRVTIATPPANGWTVSGKRRASESFSLVKGINWIYLPLSKASIAQAAGLWSAQGGLGLGAGELLEKPEPGKSSYTYYFVDPDLGAQGNNFSVAVYECYRVTITNPKTWP